MNHRFVIESFWQKKDYGNCSTVALIKAAIITYGYHRIFHKVEKKKSYLIITLKNRKLILLSMNELARFNQDNGMGFKTYRNQKLQKEQKVLRNIVRLCFAVMVKYLKEYGWDEDYLKPHSDTLYPIPDEHEADERYGYPSVYFASPKFTGDL